MWVAHNFLLSRIGCAKINLKNQFPNETHIQVLVLELANALYVDKNYIVLKIRIDKVFLYIFSL